MKKLTVENGCYVEGSWGVYATGHFADQLASLGVPISDDEMTLAHSSDDDPDELSEQRRDLCYELEDRLNDMLPDDQFGHWTDGEFVISPWCGGHEDHPGNDCQDETCYCHSC